jgi:hypothetical protein
VHVLGDLLQSVGVLIASIIIYFDVSFLFKNLKIFKTLILQNGLKLADPICTFIFSLLVMATTVSIMRDAIAVLMESTPSSVEYTAVVRDLQHVQGVRHIHSLHVWALTLDRLTAIVHLVTGRIFSNFAKILCIFPLDSPPSDWLTIQRTATNVLRKNHGVYFVNIQVEPIDIHMSGCIQCLLPDGVGINSA